MNQLLKFSYFSFHSKQLERWFLAHDSKIRFVFCGPYGFAQEFVALTLEKMNGLLKPQCTFINFISPDDELFSQENLKVVHLELLTQSEIDQALARLNGFGVETYHDEATFLYERSAGIPGVVRQYLLERLSGLNENSDRREYLENQTNSYLTRLRELIGTQWAYFERALKSEVSKQIEDYCLLKSKSGFNSKDFKLFKKTFKNLVVDHKPSIMACDQVPQDLKLNDASSLVEARALGFKVSLSPAEFEAGIYQIYLDKKFQKVVEYIEAIPDVQMTSKIKYLLMMSLDLLGFPEKALASVPEKFSSQDYFEVKIQIEKIRLQYNKIPLKEYLGNIDSLQIHFNHSDLFYLVLECERVRGIRSVDAKLALENLKKVEESLNSIRALTEIYFELGARLNFLLGYSYLFLEDFKLASKYYSDSLFFAEKIFDFKQKLIAERDLVATLYNLGRVSEALQKLRKVQEDYGSHLKNFVRYNFLQFELLIAAGQGFFSKIEKNGQEFLLNWLSKSNDHDTPMDLALFEHLFFIYTQSSQYEFLERLVTEVLEKSRLSSHSYENAFVQFVSQILKAAPRKNKKNRFLFEMLLKFRKEEGDQIILHLLTYFFELNSQFSFKLDPNQEFKKLSDEIPKGSSPAFLIYFSYQRGLHRLMEGEIEGAQSDLNTCLAESERRDFYFVKARALVGIAMVELFKGNLDRSLNHIEATKDLNYTQFPLKEEFKWVPVVQGIALYKKGAFEDSEKVFQSVDPKSSVMALVDMVSVAIGRPRPVVLNCTEDQQRMYEKIFGLLFPELSRKVSVISSMGKKYYYPHELPVYNPRLYNVIFNEVQDEVWVYGRRVNLQKQPLQQELFKYVFENQGLEISKFDLTTRIWRESYNPMIHDPRIYMAMMRLRKMLIGENLKRGRPRNDETRSKVAGLIGSSRNGYRFHIPGEWVWIRKEKTSTEFNEKQQWILGFLDQNEKVTRTIVQKTLKIGSTNAKKELQELIKRGMIKRVGSARSTEYVKNR